MDALTHAVEAYIGRSNTRKTRGQALAATKLIFENLKKACDCPGDMEARENMQMAAYMAGLAFTRAYVGNVHAIAHALGGSIMFRTVWRTRCCCLMCSNFTAHTSSESSPARLTRPV